MRIVELEIKNWEKHNPRSDVKTARWFKMSNEFFSDPEFYGTSLEARTVWIYLLCTASKKMKSIIKINTQMIADNLRISVDSVDYAIIELERCASITTSPVTLVNNDLQPERKEKVTIAVRALEERRGEEKRGEEIREDGLKVNPDFLIETWNNTMANKFKFSYCHGFSGEDQKDLITTISYKDFNKRDLWLEIYRKTLASEFLNGTKDDFVATPNWLAKHKNALKVLNGQYSGTSRKQKGGKSAGIAPTPDNPTGDPYQAELNQIRKSGAIA